MRMTVGDALKDAVKRSDSMLADDVRNMIDVRALWMGIEGVS